MFLVPDNETLIETKACKHCGVSFPITDKDLEFYEKVSPTFGNQKYLIPSPTLCPECREQRRLCWRSRRKLYKRRCDATGRDIISMFHPESGYMVYHSKIYESDVFDGRTYGKDFDFTQSFFSQFDALLLEVPLPHLAVVESTLENADYVNGANHVKNSYLSNNIVEVDEVYYCEEVYFSQNCVDSLSLKSSQECYECTDSRDLTACQHLYSCENCSHCSYSQYCK